MRRGVQPIDRPEDARYLASLVAAEGRQAYTARLFRPTSKGLRRGAFVGFQSGTEKRGDGIVRVGGRAIFWTDEPRLQYEGPVPLVTNCAYCGRLHVYRPSGGVHCHYGRFVVEIVESMPSLRNAPRMPWSATKFYRWFRTWPGITSGSHHAAAFVLSVWDSTGPWSKGKYAFNVVRAFQSWDEAHRDAFRRWAAKPWWP